MVCDFSAIKWKVFKSASYSDARIFYGYLVSIKGIMFKQQDVCKAGAGGRYEKFRIPASIITKSGSIVLTVEAQYGKGGDWDSSDIFMRRSVDNGNTLGDPVRLLSHVEFGAQLITLL